MATASPHRPIICFGSFELDVQLGVLRKNGIRLRCQEQPLQVLAALAERPGELVTREELRHRVWSHDTFVDFDRALNTAVKKIRATLNDDADAPRYIETVPRRGYRFVAPLEQKVPTPPPLAAPAPTRNRRWLILLGGLATVHILVFAWLLAGWRHSEASSAPDFQRLTFHQPELGEARFTPDGASVVYSVAGDFHAAGMFVARLGAPSPEPIGTLNSVLLAVSHQGEIAFLEKGQKPGADTRYHGDSGTLARVSLGGNAPRKLLPDVERADWSPDGQLAVVRHVGHRGRLEFPVGKVLYESAGWIDSPRFSPKGDSIAFVDHPVVPDDRGSLTLVDLHGTRKVLSGFWESMRGLAWNPRGDEIWFAAARSGVSRALYAVSLNGRERRVLSLAGGLSLRDISRDGRVLLTRDNERLGMLFMGPGEKTPRELSWKDWSIAVDISPDGKQILFGEEGEDSGSSYQVGLRPTDGSPPVILGPGVAQSLSPDGKWALSIMPPPDDQVVLLPTEAGSPKPLERGSIERYEFAGARWSPDAKRIVFAGYESGHGSRCYAQSIEGGDPRAFTPDGIVFCSVSPNGLVLALAEDHRALLYASISAEKPDKEFRLEASEWPVGWSPDGKFLYLARVGQTPVTITRFEVASEHRQEWKQVVPPIEQENMEMKCEDVVITPDGKYYAYTYMYHASDLYLVQGLR